MVFSATSLTEVYTWNDDGTLASAPGSGYTKLFEYDEEQHLTRISHNTGGTIATAYEYGYAADGGRRWRKDYAAGVWTWYPCGVACNAGELVEQTSTLAGGTWTTSALYLKAGSGCSSQIIRRNGEYHYADILGAYSLITDGSANILSNALFDRSTVQRFGTGSAQTPWQFSAHMIDVENLVIDIENVSSVCFSVNSRALSLTSTCQKGNQPAPGTSCNDLGKQVGAPQWDCVGKAHKKFCRQTCGGTSKISRCCCGLAGVIVICKNGSVGSLLDSSMLPIKSVDSTIPAPP